MAERLTFSRSLYAPEAIAAAAAAYGELGSFTVEVDEHEVRVELEAGEGAVADLSDHFANHVLYAAIVGSRPGMEP